MGNIRIPRDASKLPLSASRVIRASRLSAEAKLVWLEDFVLDRGPDGAFAGAGILAERLGMSRETVERRRRELLAAGLHAKADRGRGKTAAWYCTLPCECVPSPKPGADEVARLAAALNMKITGAAQTPLPTPDPLGRDASPTPPDCAPDATPPVAQTPLPAQSDRVSVSSPPPYRSEKVKDSHLGVRVIALAGNEDGERQRRVSRDVAPPDAVELDRRRTLWREAGRLGLPSARPQATSAAA